MARLYFHYAAMNAGKSTLLLQAAYNYKERGMAPLLFTAAIDDRMAPAQISSRIGISADALLFAPETDLFTTIKPHQVDCVLLDEAQFLTKPQVWSLAKVADVLKIPVICYGLRTDFQGNLFEGSATLLAIADTVREIKTICWCGRKATMVLRLDTEGTPVRTGKQIEVGGNETYVSVCRHHWSTQHLK